jgi:post-segregation antitoxin (ccd killing protein)
MSFVRTITVKVDDRLRKRMAQVTINWSRYIRESIVERIEREEELELDHRSPERRSSV